MPEIVGRHQRQQIVGRVGNRSERIGLMTVVAILLRQDGNPKPKAPCPPPERLMRYLAEVDIDL
jgi:hypothetical protein